MAVAHRVLIIAYHILRDGTEYQELGGSYYDRKSPEKTANRLAKRLERIGYKVAAATAKRGHTRDPDQYRKCSDWGIPCIHARNAKSTPTANPDSTTSSV